MGHWTGCTKRKKRYIVEGIEMGIFPVAVYYVLYLGSSWKILQGLVTLWTMTTLVHTISGLLLFSDFKFIQVMKRVSLYLETLTLIIGIIYGGGCIAKAKPKTVKDPVKNVEITHIRDQLESFDTLDKNKKQLLAQRIVELESRSIGLKEEVRVFVTEISNDECAGFTRCESNNIYISQVITDNWEFVSTVLHEFFHQIEYRLTDEYREEESTNLLVDSLVGQRLEMYRIELENPLEIPYYQKALEKDADWYSTAHIDKYFAY